jgi:hypothetical protein
MYDTKGLNGMDPYVECRMQRSQRETMLVYTHISFLAVSVIICPQSR